MEIKVPRAADLKKLRDHARAIQMLVLEMDKQFRPNSDLVQGDAEFELCHDRMVLAARRILQHALRQEKAAIYYLSVFNGEKPR